jgi:hypothetical protein
MIMKYFSLKKHVNYENKVFMISDVVSGGGRILYDSELIQNHRPYVAVRFVT